MPKAAGAQVRLTARNEDSQERRRPRTKALLAAWQSPDGQAQGPERPSKARRPKDADVERSQRDEVKIKKAETKRSGGGKEREGRRTSEAEDEAVKAVGKAPHKLRDAAPRSARQTVTRRSAYGSASRSSKDAMDDTEEAAEDVEHSEPDDTTGYGYGYGYGASRGTASMIDDLGSSDSEVSECTTSSSSSRCGSSLSRAASDISGCPSAVLSDESWAPTPALRRGPAPKSNVTRRISFSQEVTVVAGEKQSTTGLSTKVGPPKKRLKEKIDLAMAKKALVEDARLEAPGAADSVQGHVGVQPDGKVAKEKKKKHKKEKSGVEDSNFAKQKLDPTAGAAPIQIMPGSAITVATNLNGAEVQAPKRKNKKRKRKELDGEVPDINVPGPEAVSARVASSTAEERGADNHFDAAVPASIPMNTATEKKQKKEKKHKKEDGGSKRRRAEKDVPKDAAPAGLLDPPQLHIADGVAGPGLQDAKPAEPSTPAGPTAAPGTPDSPTDVATSPSVERRSAVAPASNEDGSPTQIVSGPDPVVGQAKQEQQEHEVQVAAGQEASPPPLLAIIPAAFGAEVFVDVQPVKEKKKKKRKEKETQKVGDGTESATGPAGIPAADSSIASDLLKAAEDARQKGTDAAPSPDEGHTEGTLKKSPSALGPSSDFFWGPPPAESLSLPQAQPITAPTATAVHATTVAPITSTTAPPVSSVAGDASKQSSRRRHSSDGKEKKHSEHQGSSRNKRRSPSATSPAKRAASSASSSAGRAGRRHHKHRRRRRHSRSQSASRIIHPWHHQHQRSDQCPPAGNYPTHPWYVWPGTQGSGGYPHSSWGSAAWGWPQGPPRKPGQPAWALPPGASAAPAAPVSASASPVGQLALPAPEAASSPPQPLATPTVFGAVAKSSSAGLPKAAAVPKPAATSLPGVAPGSIEVPTMIPPDTQPPPLGNQPIGDRGAARKAEVDHHPATPAGHEASQEPEQPAVTPTKSTPAERAFESSPDAAATVEAPALLSTHSPPGEARTHGACPEATTEGNASPLRQNDEPKDKAEEEFAPPSKLREAGSGGSVDGDPALAVPAAGDAVEKPAGPPSNQQLSPFVKEQLGPSKTSWHPPAAAAALPAKAEDSAEVVEEVPAGPAVLGPFDPPLAAGRPAASGGCLGTFAMPMWGRSTKWGRPLCTLQLQAPLWNGDQLHSAEERGRRGRKEVPVDPNPPENPASPPAEAPPASQSVPTQEAALPMPHIAEASKPGARTIAWRPLALLELPTCAVYDPLQYSGTEKAVREQAAKERGSATLAGNEKLAGLLKLLEDNTAPASQVVQSFWVGLTAAERQQFSVELPELMHLITR